jgi:hypothetical protein
MCAIMQFFLHSLIISVTTSLWDKCEDEPHTPKSRKLESSATPKKLRAQLQGPKHLALTCSLYQWKDLEVYMSQMASHWPFGHVLPKLWAKEGPGVKLAV